MSRESQLPTKCSDVDGDRLDYDAPHVRAPYEAIVGDMVWSYGKNGGADNLGCVVVRIESCATDQRYCHEGPWGSPCEHRLVPMCECGNLAFADHHWRVLPYV